MFNTRFLYHKCKTMKYSGFVGIDVSKATIDVSVMATLSSQAAHCVLGNDTKGFKAMVSWLRKAGFLPGKLFYCLEHTGVYSLELSYWLDENGFIYYLGNPLDIKRSLGLVRGKSDKADSKHLARYAAKNHEELKLTRMPSKLLLEIKSLLTHRQMLARQKRELKQAKKRLTTLSKSVDTALIRQQQEEQLEFVIEQIERVDQKLEALSKYDELVNRNVSLARSVTGIGLVIAMHMVVQTHNFTGFDNGRQFACYSGSAPFEYSSGTSIRGKTRVHPIANKRMKGLMSNGAVAAIRYDKEIKRYWERKRAEGKAKGVVLNAVRCKLINRVFATVQRGTPYVTLNF